MEVRVRLASIRAIGAAFLAAMLVLVLPVSINSIAVAQQTAEDMRFSAWTVRCLAVENDQENCWLIQTLFEEGTNRFLAEIRLGVAGSAEDPQYVLVMAAPTGILLTARPAFRIDGAAEGTPMNWHNCNESRCVASKTLTSEDVQSLRHGAQMIIGYHRFMAPEPTVFALSLLGVTAGLSALTELQAR